MENKVKINVRTFKGQKAILEDLRDSLKELPEGVKGLKSIYYHKRKVEDLLKGLERGDKDVLAKSIKYTLRGGKHSKPLDIKIDKRGVQTYTRATTKSLYRGVKAISITTFKDFVDNWNTIKSILLEYGANTTLKQILFGSGYTYDALKERLARDLGMSLGDLIEFLNIAKNVYYSLGDELKLAIRFFNEDYLDLADNPNNQELLNKVEQWYKEINSYAQQWGLESNNMISFYVVDGMDSFLPDAISCGSDVVNEFNW